MSNYFDLLFNAQSVIIIRDSSCTVVCCSYIHCVCLSVYLSVTLRKCVVEMTEHIYIVVQQQYMDSSLSRQILCEVLIQSQPLANNLFESL